jgi:hypothetical protein
MFEIVKCTLSTKIPPIVFHRRRDGRIRRAAGSKLTSKSERPERLSASVQKLQSFSGRSPGFKTPLFGEDSFTVARPRGNFTRFPILPTPVGHLDAFEYKEQSDLGGHYHAIFRVSNKASATCYCAVY